MRLAAILGINGGRFTEPPQEDIYWDLEEYLDPPKESSSDSKRIIELLESILEELKGLRESTPVKMPRDVFPGY
jgi:hypothetical protein